MRRNSFAAQQTVADYQERMFLKPHLEPLERDIARQQALIEQLSAHVAGLAAATKPMQISMHCFEGGILPQRQTDGAVGYDAYARAVVHATNRSAENSALRLTRASFIRDQKGDPVLEDETLLPWVVPDPNDKNKYAVSLPPGERLMVGLGFATAMAFPDFYWVAPRSGYAARGITIANAPGTVDSDYRGEAGALIENNSNESFVVSHGQRIAQILFQRASVPSIEIVQNYEQLGQTDRSTGGFGSTGTH